MLALELGAFALGFVFEPSSPRYVGTPDWAPEWLSELGGLHVAAYGVAPSCNPPAGFGAIQAVDWSRGTEVLSTGAKPIWVLRPKPGELRIAILPERQTLPYILLDSYDSAAYGGTGKTTDWDLAETLIAELRARPALQKTRLGLAGGLTPDNVAKAVEIVKPDYVDVSSGVESAPGIKDPEKLRAFFKALGR